MEDSKLYEKVRPIPIGLDLHSLSEKVRGTSHQQVRNFVCAQRQDIKSVRTSNYVQFKDRPVSVNAEFQCEFTSPKGRIERLKTRGEICNLLSKERNGNSSFTIADHVTFGSNRRRLSPEQGRLRKVSFWERLSKGSFSLAPPGFGTDTHRLWEILQMHTVPIVITSPLDPLYKQFPIVIVNDWKEVFEIGALEKFKKEIIEKWGENPFNDETMYRLSSDYWAEEVNRKIAHKNKNNF